MHVAILWVAVMAGLSHVGWFAQNLDPATSAFLLIIGFGIGYHYTRKRYGIASLIFLIPVPLLLFFGLTQTAERFAIIAYWFLAAAVASGIGEIYHNDKS